MSHPDQPSATVAVVINKSKPHLNPSETFLHTHISGLSARVLSLIGPLTQRYSKELDRHAASQALPFKAARWTGRRAGLTTVHEQDEQALYRFFRRHRVQAVLAEYGPTAVACLAACRRLDLPLIAHFHGFDAYRHSVVEEHAAGYRQLFDQAAAVIGVSRHMCSRLLELGANPERLYHNACGADLDTALQAQPGQAPPEFIMVGRLVEKKAPLLTLLAFSRVVQAVPEARLQIIGDGALLAASQQLVRALGLTDRVQLHGAQDHEAVAAALQRARCFVQHSVVAPDGDREGTPVAVLEAMAMGLAVVATRHGGIEDVVEHGVTGWLGAEYDVDAMAEAMVRIAQQPDLAATIGQQARQHALQHHTSEHSMNRLNRILQTVLEGRAYIEPFAP